MLFNEKLMKNADLVIPFERCLYFRPVDNCPFVKFWTMDVTYEHEHPILVHSDEELEELRVFHRKCLVEQVKRAQESFVLDM